MSSLRRSRAGFTLIELMVAIGLTGVVAVGLYSLSMVASQTFQQQQRISEIQLRLRSAMELLRADVQRAGYMSTPNSALDPLISQRPATAVQAVLLDRPAVNPTHNATDNTNIDPVRLLMTGNYVTTDQYRIMYVNGNVVFLQQQTPEFGRIANASAFQRIFVGRMVRIQAANGSMQFSEVSDATYAPPTGAVYPTLTLTTPVAVIGASSAGSTTGVGVAGLGTGGTIAPISTVEYRIADVSATQSNAYVDSPQFSTGKTDLVRREMVVGGGGMTPVASSERIVAEYAVDFDVAAVIDNAVTGTLVEPNLLRYPFGDANNFALLGAAGAGAAAPQRLRTLVIRLSVRDRAQDPDFGWVARAAGTPLTRFRVFPAQAGAARVRSLTTEVTLPNLASRNLR